MDFLSIRLAGGKVDAVENNYQNRYGKSESKIAIIPILGTMTQRADLMTQYSGGTSTDSVIRAINEAVSNTAYKSIILDVDSPGGSVYGLEELKDTIKNAAKTKRVIAVSNSMMASAAYYVSSAATKIVSAPGGQVGSIGTIAVHIDQSKAIEDSGYKYTFITAGKYKALGNASEPLTDEALGYYQDMVNQYYDMFVSAVADGRRVDKQTVKDSYGQGKVLSAKDALKVGMIDQIKTLRNVIDSELRRYQR